MKKYDHDDGECLDVVRLQDFPWHVDQCEFAPVICGNEGCGMVVNKSSKENHEKNFCKFRIAKYEVPKAHQNEMEASKKVQVKQSFLCLCLYACYFDIFYAFCCWRHLHDKV